MDTILIVLIAIFAIAGILYLLSKLRMIITILAWAFAIYLFAVADNFWGASLIIGAWVIFQSLTASFVDSEKQTEKKVERKASAAAPKKTKRAKRKSIYHRNPSGFYGKRPGELDVYDYEQHLKSNGK
jgi:hypothetical protein